MAGGKPQTPEAVLERAREIQRKLRLSLRDLQHKLKSEGHDVSIFTLSKAGLSAENFAATPATAPAVARKGAAKLAAAPRVPPPPPSPPPASGPPVCFDADGTPLAMARAMLKSVTEDLATLDAETPAYARLHGEARQLTKLVATLEREAAGEETEEERVARLRREDGETRREVEKYVNQQLAIALRETPEAPHGRCPTCAEPLTQASRQALTGGGA